MQLVSVLARRRCDYLTYAGKNVTLGSMHMHVHE